MGDSGEEGLVEGSGRQPRWREGRKASRWLPVMLRGQIPRWGMGRQGGRGLGVVTGHRSLKEDEGGEVTGTRSSLRATAVVYLCWSLPSSHSPCPRC